MAGIEASAPESPSAGPHAGHDLRSATLSQAGQKLVFSVHTAAPIALKKLDRTPAVRAGSGRYLCLSMEPTGRHGGRRVCLGGIRSPRHRAGLELVNAKGGTTSRSTIPVRVRRPQSRNVVLALQPAVAGLTPHRYRWRAIENRAGCGGCETSLPSRGSRVFRLRPVRAVGCTGGGAGLITSGPSSRRAVALTFDDGPSEYTDDFLDVLREQHAHATFFEIGQEVPGRADTMRRILREGSEIGNHTTHHETFTGYWDLAATSALIRSATHFQPCLFRPPAAPSIPRSSPPQAALA